MTSRSDALQRQIQTIEKRVHTRQAQHDRFANWRLVVLGGGFVLTILAYRQGGDMAALGMFGISVLIFGALVTVHRRYQMSLARWQALHQIKKTHVARMRLDWANIPAHHITLQNNHPYERDIDVPDLQRLLNTANSRDGAKRLYTWLLDHHPDLATIQKRQTIVRELTPLTTFRDQLAVVGRLASRDQNQPWSGQQVVKWLQQQVLTDLRPAFYVLSALSIVNVILLALNLGAGLPPIWIVTWLIYGVVFIRQWQHIQSLFEDGIRLSHTLQNLTAVLGFVENYRYGKHTALKNLCQPIISARPSRVLRGVSWTVAGVSLRQNPILYPLVMAIIPWDMFFAIRMQTHKRDLRDHLPGWLDTWSELEALCSLATFAYLNPAYTFPTVQPDSILEADHIGHPLIDPQEKVCNDFSLSQLGEVMIITGSNMSGKSSFLRTLGVNLVLAYAGSVVNARRLEVGIFRVFSSIRLTDSLNDGISFFYAEVKRLRALLDALEDEDALPLFFLIDEIFRGTNNRERLIGSRAYINAVTGKNGVGLIATHDLELVKLEDELGNIRNYHFREDIVEGRMVFDYQIREGASPTTNALRVMALEGLPVEF